MEHRKARSPKRRSTECIEATSLGEDSVEAFNALSFLVFNHALVIDCASSSEATRGRLAASEVTSIRLVQRRRVGSSPRARSRVVSIRVLAAIGIRSSFT